MIEPDLPRRTSRPSLATAILLGVGLGVLVLGALSLGPMALAQENLAQDPAAAPGSTMPSAAAGTWLSLLPPLIAIGLALLFKDVVVALLVAVLSGALLVHGPNPFTAFARTVDSYVLGSLSDPDKAAILVFSALLGAMVGVVSKSGGTQGIVEWLAPRATDSRRGQVAAWLMGLAIFFDDYANTLIVGSTMRPITDRLKISREKLAYIVDSTAAPVVSLIPISTWIGVEIGLVQQSFTSLGLDRDAFTTIVASLPYRFYQVFALALGLSIALSRRDVGPMLAAERRALSTGEVLADGDVPLADFSSSELAPIEGKPRRARNALLPITTVVGVVLFGLVLTGSSALVRSDYGSWIEWLRDVFSNADSYATLQWASFAGVVVAIVLATSQRVLSLRDATGAAVAGIKATLVAFVVLLLAWSLGTVCTDLDTAGFLVGATEGALAPQLLPLLTFVIAGAVAFATGTSWGTMGILTPLVIPLAHNLAISAGFDTSSSVYSAVLLGTIASVLAGSVWGDHCSPISDTTILSSMASGCDHLAHVKTQLPYALSAGGFAMVLGLLPASFGLSPWISLLVGIAATALAVRFVAQKVESGPANPRTAGAT